MLSDSLKISSLQALPGPLPLKNGRQGSRARPCSRARMKTQEGFNGEKGGASSHPVMEIPVFASLAERSDSMSVLFMLIF